MTPEEMQNEINQLKEKVKSLEASGTISKPVEDAFRERFRLDTFLNPSVSGKSATSEQQSVNEAGSAVYAVLKNPDLFLQVTISGTTYYIPVWN